MGRVFGAFNSYNKKETIFRMEKKICNIMKPENQDKVRYSVKKKNCSNFNCKEMFFNKKDQGQTY